MKKLFTFADKNPLRTTLVLSGLLHLAGFYYVSGLMLDSSVKDPKIIPIKITKLIKESKVEPKEVARSPEPAKTVRKIKPRKITPVDAARSPAPIKPSKTVMRKTVRPVSPPPAVEERALAPTSEALHQNTNRKLSSKPHPGVQSRTISEPYVLAEIGNAVPSSIQSQNRSTRRAATALPRNTERVHFSLNENEFFRQPMAIRAVSISRGFSKNKTSLQTRSVSSIGQDKPRGLSPSRIAAVQRERHRRAFQPRVRTASLARGFTEEVFEHEESDTIKEASMDPKGAEKFSALELGELRRGFVNRVWGRVAGVKYYPRIARKRGLEGRPVVTFTLDSRGDLINLNLTTPSNHKMLNEAALETIRRGTPYPPIPEPLEKNSITFKLPISYILGEP
ncbi:hypothetical protein UZ36_01060 [Candidatus Nitromaritima sp. SCGC AAA799-C22]|nr:hypothetical protein UZ36_01060 [Candidatus Nitromaritima sp. SCGC AAA799-C22]